jgi:hypothetical protein
MARAFVQTLATVHCAEEGSIISSISQGKKCIRIIWDTILVLWKQRNEFIYGITQETKKAALVRAIETKANQCYDWRPYIPFDDQRRLFQKSKEELLSEDLPHIQTWVRMAERIILEQTKKRPNGTITNEKGLSNISNGTPQIRDVGRLQQKIRSTEKTILSQTDMK